MLLEEVKEELLIVTPCFIPTEKGIEVFRHLIARGVIIRVLTNSLASNNHAIANAAYKHYRKPLLKAGVELYELRADAEDRDVHSAELVDAKWHGLHAKVVVFDRAKVFFGTMNIDPRSMIQNTEIGLVAENRELTGWIIGAFERDMMPENAWRLELDEKERIVWKSTAGVRKTQPSKNLWQRIMDWLAPARLLEDQI
jgi:putative cardiolipin synthase